MSLCCYSFIEFLDNYPFFLFFLFGGQLPNWTLWLILNGVMEKGSGGELSRVG